jgi:hypothetical protein
MPRLVILYAAFLAGSVLWAAERNIVFFITDDMSQTIGAYGNSAIRTRPIWTHWQKMA